VHIAVHCITKWSDKVLLVAGKAQVLAWGGGLGSLFFVCVEVCDFFIFLLWFRCMLNVVVHFSV